MISTVNAKLKKKVMETTLLVKQLQQSHDTLSAETKRLGECREAVDLELKQLQKPLRKCMNGAAVRTERPARENIVDSVHLALGTETTDLHTSIAEMTQWRERCDRLLDGIDKVSQLMREDIEDKHAALQVDQECINLHTTLVSPPKTARPVGVGTPRRQPIVPGAAEGPNGITKSAKAPAKWKESSTVMMVRAKEVLNQSLDLRASIEVALKRVRDTTQKNSTQSKEMLRKKSADDIVSPP